MSKTTNYNLEKPDWAGKFNLDDFNKNSDTIDGVLKEIDNAMNMPLPYGEFTFPNDWIPKLPFSIRRDMDGIVKHNADFSHFTQGGIIHCVNTETGLDTNDSLTEVTAVKSLGKAIQLALASTINGLHQIKISGYVEDGDGMKYCSGISWAIPADKTISIMSQNEGEKTYVSTGKRNGYYKSSWIVNDNVLFLDVRDKEFTNIFNLKNKDAYGVPKPLARTVTESDCRSTENTFYTLPTSRGKGLIINIGLETNLFNPNTVSLDTTLANGVLTPDTTYHTITSDPIDVVGGEKYIITPSVKGAIQGAWYDANNAFISNISDGTLLGDGYVLFTTAPTNATTVRILTYPGNFSDWATKLKFCKDNISDLIVLSGEILTTTNKPMGSNLNFTIADGGKLYTQDLIFLSGDVVNDGTSEFSLGSYFPSCLSVTGGGNNTEYWGNNCWYVGGAKGGLDANGKYDGSVQLIGGLTTRTLTSYTFECIAAYNTTDAFSYGGITTDLANTRKYLAFEFGCKMYETDGNWLSNSTTTHGGMSRLSVNCIYSKCGGGVVVDAHGGYSVLIDCAGSDANYNKSYIGEIHIGTIFGADLLSADYTARGFGGKMILINCNAFGKCNGGAYTADNIDLYILHFKTIKPLKSIKPVQPYVF